MKKLIMTTAIVLGLAMTTFAQGGSMFHRENSGDNGNAVYQERSYFSKDGNGSLLSTPGLPGHGENTNQNAPIGSGIALLTALGAAYLVGKKRREE